jgi:hypothetical protein
MATVGLIASGRDQDSGAFCRLAAALLKTEEELAALTSDEQLNLGTGPATAVQVPRVPAEKVSLFLDLFGTRRSVSSKRWESIKAGKSGYSPACNHDSFAKRQSGICRKPLVKCSECGHQRFPPLDARAVESHPRGEHPLGVYAIGADDMCRSLAAAFDGEGWRENVLAYRETAVRRGIAAAIERSRGGNGAHGWIFFADPAPSVIVRRLGEILVAKATALRPTLGLGALDRLFPNQDTPRTGGFGNWIALPLAKAPRPRRQVGVTRGGAWRDRFARRATGLGARLRRWLRRVLRATEAAPR